MSDDLTDDEIALLCAIGEADPSKLTGIRHATWSSLSPRVT